MTTRRRSSLILMVLALAGGSLSAQSPTPPKPATPTTTPTPPPAGGATPAATATPKPVKPAAPRPPAKKVDRRFTFEQISKLLSAKTSDRILARDIKARGVADEINRAALDRFKSQGAGPETMAALTQLWARSSLFFQGGEGGVTVYLDDVKAGVTDERGVLKLENLDPGPHTLRATKEARREFVQQVELRPNMLETTVANMPWTIGYLSVDVRNPQAQVAVSGAGNYNGPIQRLPVSVGEHTITVSLPMHKTVTAKVVVRGGDPVSVPIRLEIDPAAVQAIYDRIAKQCADKQYETVEKQIQDYEKYKPMDSALQTCLSVAYLKLKQYDQFQTLALKSLAQGGDFTFPVQHVHGNKRKGMHDALLTISQNEVHYEPKGKCNLVAFSRLRKDAEWSLHPQPDGGSELTLSLPEADPKKRLVMNFVDPDEGQLRVIYRLATGK